MNEHRDDKPYCYFHPKEVIIGVCPFCLNERLLVLASKQAGHLLSSKSSHTSSGIVRKPIISFPKIFALGSFLNHLEFRHRKSNNSDHDSSTSPEDSFISIKFEDNGVASWEKGKGTVSQVSLEHCNKMSWHHSLSKLDAGKEPIKREIIEHAKPNSSSLRWRKRIGHLFQLNKWKRSSKGSVRHVGTKVEGVKVMRKGWIRNLTTKRKTKE